MSRRVQGSQVQELLNFGASGSLWLWGWGVGGWGWGWLGGAPTHMHIHTCMCGKHDNFMQISTPIGFEEIPGIPYDVMCACTCVGGILSPHPPPATHPHPPGGTPGISQNSIALELIEIIQFCLKIYYL